MLIHQLLQDARDLRPAIIFEGETLSYAALDDLANQFAHLFGEMRLDVGDRVSLLIGNEPLVVAAYFGLFKTGLIANPINNRLTAHEVTFVLEHSQARVLITTPEYLSLAQEAIAGLTHQPRIVLLGADAGVALPVDVFSERDLRRQKHTPRHIDGINEQTPILLIYTSGTTGRPKGVLLSHANVWADGLALSQGFRMGPDHVALCFMPLFHCNALIVSHISAFIGHGTIVLCRKFSAREHWRLVADHNVNSFSAPPTVLAILLEREAEARDARIKLDFVKTGSAPLTVELATRFENRFGKDILIEGWGLTECTATSTLFLFFVGGRRKIGSVGQALAGQEIAVVDEQGRFLPPESTGELVIRSPTMMLGYFRDEEATRKAVVDGWPHTGDLCRMDQEGYVFLVGRKKEIIIRGGENVSPLEIEEVLCRHPSVRDVAVGGLPDRIWGEVVVACVVANGAASEQELIGYCREHLADFKVPVKIALVEELPRNATGKILRRDLAQFFQPEAKEMAS